MKRTLLLLTILLAIILRLFKLGINPPSLNWDEASLGYNAYTIAENLHDEHGEFLPLSRFIAFGDYKPPGYIYTSAPFVKLFGLNEFSIRFPSFIAGTLMVLVCYLLVLELFRSRTLAMLASFLTAVSPWAIHFSRAAFEANLAAFFNLMGIYLFILSRRKKPAKILSVLFFVFSFYTFNANRIIAPLLIIGLSTVYFKDLVKNLRWTICGMVLAVLLLIPSINYLTQRESRLRFQEVSIFNNLTPIKLANQRIALDNGFWVSKIIHNRRVLFALDFLKHYTDNFSGRFLFTNGDVNPRLSLQDMGELYVWDLPFLLIGIYFIVKKRVWNFLPILIWMIVAPIPAATARETPHALRIISILPAFQIIIAYGLYQLVLWCKYRCRINKLYILFFAICCLLSANIFYFLHNYYVHFPITWSGEWQYGYKQMVEKVTARESKYDSVYVTEALGRPYIYFAFYNRYSEEEFLKNREASRDWFGFWTVNSLGKIHFGMNGMLQNTGKVLLVTTDANIPAGFRIIDDVLSPKGEIIFKIADNL